MTHRDLVIVGAGSAGIVAALSAARVDARVTLVEEDRTGGDCLWRGCVPSKALLAAAERAEAMRRADEVGLQPIEPKIDLAAVMDHVRSAQQTIAPTDSPERLREEGVEVLLGRARFTGPRRLVVDTGGGQHGLTFRRAIVATGSEPAIPPIDGLETGAALTTDTVWELTDLPERLLVVGGGAVGCELGQAFQRLGSRVTLLEAADHLLPREDAAAGRLLADRLTAEGMDVRCATPVTTVHRREQRWEVRLPTATAVADRLLVAAGRRPVTDGLGLPAAGVDTTREGAVAVDGRLRTTNGRVWAAGDVTGPPAFTHVAAHEGATAVANALFGLRRGIDRQATPRVVFTDPEVACVGLSEAEARSRHGPGVTARTVDHGDLDRAVVTGRTAGFTKLVAGPGGRLVGAVIVGPRAGDSIAEAVALIAGEHDLEEAGQLIHAYPTFSEAIGQAGTAALRDRVDDPRVQALAGAVLWGARQLDRIRS